MRLVTWILRIGTALTFTGHGLVALAGKAQWLSYLMVTGMSKSLAQTLLPYIGAVDLAVALVVLIRPLGFVLVWATLWAFVTALVRPLAGEGWLAFIERGANWATPLALLLIQQFADDKDGERGQETRKN